jgi:hypothetical protein
VVAPCLALAVFLVTTSARKAPSTSARLSRSTRHSPLSGARPLPSPKVARCARFVVRRGRALTVCSCSLSDPCSLGSNSIGDEGAQHIGEALQINKTLTLLECAPASVCHSCQMRSKGALTLCGCSLFGPRSLWGNQIGAEGASFIGESLKVNQALTSLKCAPRIPTTPSQVRSLYCQRGRLTACGCSLFCPRSLAKTSIGAKGAQHIGESLKVNKALTSLMCAPRIPTAPSQMRSLCCQQGGLTVLMCPLSLSSLAVQSCSQRLRCGRSPAHWRGPQEQHSAHFSQVRARNPTTTRAKYIA